jgi:hypothetical protein
MFSGHLAFLYVAIYYRQRTVHIKKEDEEADEDGQQPTNETP